jgi:hypothetical protein
MDVYLGGLILSNYPHSLWQPVDCTALGVATRLRAGRSGFRIPEKAEDSSLLQNVQADSVVHRNLIFYG